MAVCNNILELIGNTPMLRVKKFEKKMGAKAKIYAKLECMNPAGSAKDRAAAAMILAAEEDGTLKEGGTIIEPTSGNTGIGLAFVGRSRGYKVVLTMPSSMSKERISLMQAYGAEVVLTDGKLGMKGAIEKAEELRDETEGAVILGQFDNPANARAHYETTGPEICKDMAEIGEEVSAFVAGVGTGGTITGAGRYIKEKYPAARIFAVEPAASPMLSKGEAGAHKIQGLGAGFVPKILDTSVYDEVLPVENEAAFDMAREFAKMEGILPGISGGAALWAAAEVAKRKEFAKKSIVVLLPDTGERYLSLGLFED